MTDERPVSVADAERLEAAGLWLVCLRDEALTEAQMREWIEWCEREPANAAAFEHLQSLWKAAGEHVPPQAGLPHRNQGTAWWAALAASLAAAAAVGSLFVARPQWFESNRVAARDIVHTGIAHNRNVLLPDGSRADIGASSVVSVDFTGPRRRLQLRDGEAYFHVEHDARKAFVVEVDEVEVMAIGTAFNVRRAANQLAVTVSEGVVEVRRRHDSLRMRAAAGEQIVFDLRSGEVRRSRIDPELALAWRRGRLEFSGDPLDVVVASVNRYAARPIEMRGAGLEGLRFTGTVSLEAIDAWVEGLPEIFPVDVRREVDYDIVGRTGGSSVNP